MVRRGGSTVKPMLPLPVRDRASVIVKGRLLAPADTAPTVVWKEKTSSPGVTSPLVPSSRNVWRLAPPIAERLAVTDRMGLAGPVPGVTVTVSRVGVPAGPELGFAAPTPVGPVLPQTWAGEAEFRGIGAPAEKSARLSSVSAQPSASRNAGGVLLGVGAAPAPSKKLAFP